MTFPTTNEKELRKDPTFFFFSSFHINTVIAHTICLGISNTYYTGKKRYVQLSTVCSAPM